MSDILGHFIQGRSIIPPAARLHPIYNPATGEVIAQGAFATVTEVHDAVTAAQKAFQTWSTVTPLRRARILFRFKELLEKHIETLAQLLTREHGKVLEDAKGEVQRAIELVEFSCGTPYLLKGSYSENVGAHIDSYTVHQPLGVCAGITPFNFPIMISAWMLAPAIACGNTFVLKPSEKDPSCVMLLVKLMQEAGLPDGVLNVIHGDKEAVDALITHPSVVAVSSVGSTPVAEHIYQTAVAQGKRAHTFGGAKNHCVILPDANIQEVADNVLGAAYGAAGERCMALSVAVAVTDAVGDALVNVLKEKITGLKIGPGTEAMDMGPLVTKLHLDRVLGYVQQGVQEGAQLVVDGRHFKSPYSGFFMGACLFDHVKPTMRIYREEIFGPVLVIVRVPDLESAIQLINQHEYGNGVAIFTRDGYAARHFATQIQVGMVGINIPIPVPVAYHIFGGWKRSIFGDVAMHGEENVRFYTRPKTITVRWPREKSTTSSYHMPSS